MNKIELKDSTTLALSPAKKKISVFIFSFPSSRWECILEYCITKTSQYQSSLPFPHNPWHWNISNALLYPHNLASQGFDGYN